MNNRIALLILTLSTSGCGSDLVKLSLDPITTSVTGNSLSLQGDCQGVGPSVEVLLNAQRTYQTAECKDSRFDFSSVDLHYLSEGPFTLSLFGGNEQDAVSLVKQENDIQITSNILGNLFFNTDLIQFNLSISCQDPTDVAAVVRDIDGKVVYEASDLSMNQGVSQCTLSVPLPLQAQGWYRSVWTFKNANVERSQWIDLAIIPNNDSSSLRPSSPFGVNVHFDQGWNPAIASIIQRSGIAWIRDHMGGPYDSNTQSYTTDDPTYTLATNHNLSFLPISSYFLVNFNNGVWSNDDAEQKVRAYATRHNGRINYFELYNEPHNLWEAQYGSDWLKRFVAFGKTQTDAIHQGSPTMKVFWPEDDVFGATPEFVHENALPQLEAVAAHTYNLHKSNPFPETQPLLLSMPEIQNFFSNNSMNVPMWATEIGWSSYSDDGKSSYFYAAQTEKQQAEKLVRSMFVHLAAGMGKVFWYDFYNDFEGVLSSEANFGLIRYKNFQPKPSVVAYSNLIKWMTGGQLLTRKSLKSDAFEFLTQSNDHVVATWTRKGPAACSFPSSNSITVSDIYGRSNTLSPQSGYIQLTLTQSPVFIEGLNPAEISSILDVLASCGS